MNSGKFLYKFIEELKKFDYRIESVDPTWDVIFPDRKGKWHHIRVSKYQESHYVALIDGELDTLEISSEIKILPGQTRLFSRHRDDADIMDAWSNLIVPAIAWLKIVEKDWIKANKKVYALYPLNRRFGIAPNALIRELLPDIYQLDKDLGKAKTKKFIQLVDVHEKYYKANDLLWNLGVW